MGRSRSLVNGERQVTRHLPVMNKRLKEINTMRVAVFGIEDNKCPYMSAWTTKTLKGLAMPVLYTVPLSYAATIMGVPSNTKQNHKKYQKCRLQHATLTGVEMVELQYRMTFSSSTGFQQTLHS